MHARPSALTGSLSSYRLLLFDLDGTLTDPKLGITTAVQHALAACGIQVADRDTLLRFIGPPLHHAFAQFYGFDQNEIATAIAAYRAYYATVGLFENRVYPGIPALLAQLSAAGKQLVVATSKPTIFAKQILAHFELDHYFAHIIGSHLDQTRSAKSEIIAHALSLYPNIPTSAALMIGDREHDMLGAQACGIASLAVDYGYGSDAELSAANPTYRAHTVTDLADLINDSSAIPAQPIAETNLPLITEEV